VSTEEDINGAGHVKFGVVIDHKHGVFLYFCSYKLKRKEEEN
jgi:hypothetical protein